MSACRPFSKHL